MWKHCPDHDDKDDDGDDYDDDDEEIKQILGWNQTRGKNVIPSSSLFHVTRKRQNANRCNSEGMEIINHWIETRIVLEKVLRP